MHPHSEQALKKVKEDGTVDRRKQMILEVLREHPLGMTDREILIELNKREQVRFYDMNHVRPRITEMINRDGVLEAVGKTRCKNTQTTVRVVGIRNGTQLFDWASINACKS